MAGHFRLPCLVRKTWAMTSFDVNKYTAAMPGVERGSLPIVRAFDPMIPTLTNCAGHEPLAATCGSNPGIPAQ